MKHHWGYMAEIIVYITADVKECSAGDPLTLLKKIK